MAEFVVLGAGGFIGGSLAARLAARGASVRAVTRRPTAPAPGVSTLAMGDLTPRTDWSGVLEDVRGVVHLASASSLVADASTAADLIETEVAAARHLAGSAVVAGVRQLVLMSTIKVHGEETLPGAPLTADRPLAPVDAYATLKLRTEQAMAEAVRQSETALAVIRPPLVYGSGVKANFRTLLGLVRRAPVLPFASIANRRSLIHRENLVDLIAQVLLGQEPLRGTFLARDDEDLSTPELIRRIGHHLSHRPLLLPFPVSALSCMGRMLGWAATIDRLTQSLEVDDRATRVALGWMPRIGVDDGLAETCRWFLEWERSQ
jgi:nucleoside-diphosphate-sugar epimerase